VQSIYHWRGRIETGKEIPVVIKTRSLLYSDVEAAIRKIHPYDTPEIVAIPVVQGDARYLAWIAESTGAR
jgi:periplasmic divalent cation tolerance protein